MMEPEELVAVSKSGIPDLGLGVAGLSREAIEIACEGRL
jgi:hypothetical protein